MKHAAISADENAGGMFRKWPFFQRLLSWTKPYAPFEQGTREYERYDWNSLLPEEKACRALMCSMMDGTSYYPSRPEMQRNLEAFAERTGKTFRVHTRKAESAAELVFEVDDVIAATGFTSPIQDLVKLGVATVGRNKLPAQTPFWESASVPGVYFGGTIHQASPGLRKHGLPSNSGGVNGHRYNGRILARRVAKKHFGIDPERPVVARAEVVSYLLHEVTNAPELWHQKSYLARVLVQDPKRGIVDDGILPLQSFLDSGPADGVAATLEENPTGDIYPVLYTRRGGVSAEHALPPHPLHDFRTRDHEKAVVAALEGLLL